MLICAASFVAVYSTGDTARDNARRIKPSATALAVQGSICSGDSLAAMSRHRCEIVGFFRVGSFSSNVG